LFLKGVAALVGEGILLSPQSATNQVGSPHTLTAKVQDANGNPIVGTTVTFKVTSGPNTGTLGTAKTDATGTATFTYTSSKAGTDTIVATFTDSTGKTFTSNSVTKTWTPKPTPPPPKKKKKKKVHHGKARLSGVPAACVLMPFTARVTGSRIASVSWSLGSHRISGRTVKRGSKYSARISLNPGSHHLTVKVKFVSSSHTRAKTFHRTVSGCAVVAPKFTG
jgi:hypothetical protein